MNSCLSNQKINLVTQFVLFIPLSRLRHLFQTNSLIASAILVVKDKPEGENHNETCRKYLYLYVERDSFILISPTITDHLPDHIYTRLHKKIFATEPRVPGPVVMVCSVYKLVCFTGYVFLPWRPFD